MTKQKKTLFKLTIQRFRGTQKQKQRKRDQIKKSRSKKKRVLIEFDLNLKCCLVKHNLDYRYAEHEYKTRSANTSICCVC